MPAAVQYCKKPLKPAIFTYFLVPHPGHGFNRRMNADPVAQTAPNSAQSFETLLLAVGRDRDRAAFMALFHHFAPRLKSFLMKQGGAARLTPELAEELVQETMLTVWNRAESFDPARASAGTWIFTIARNKRIDALRRKSRVNYDEADPAFIPDTHAPTPDQAVIATDRNEKLALALNTLPPEQEAIIRKAFYEGKTHNQIAHEDKIPLGTVKSRLRLAMDKLHRQLGKNGKELL